MKSWLLIAALPFAGCDLAPSSDPVYSAGIAVACGVAAAMPDGAPDPEPDNAVCRSCGGTGWLGDGTIKEDCPDCETPWKQSPPAAPSPESEVIQLDDPAAEQGNAEPRKPIIDMDQVSEAITREAGRVYYTQFVPASKVAAETNRPLVLFVGDRLPPEFDPPSGVVCCCVAAPPEGFVIAETPAAILFGQVTFEGHSGPVLLDPSDLQDSLSIALEKLR